MPRKSLVNVAYDVLSNEYAIKGKDNFKPMEFSQLLLKVGDELGIESQEELTSIASRFYTDLTLDGRFVIKEGNTWVLREYVKYEDVHIDMNEVYKDLLEQDEEVEEELDSNSETSASDGEESSLDEEEEEKEPSFITPDEDEDN